VRRLKLRRVTAPFTIEPRVHRQTMIRWLYLAVVGGLALWLFNLFFGSFFYLRSEGMVLGEPAVVAAEFPVTVRDIRAHAGDRVSAGQVTAVVSSQAVVETIARMAGDQADRDVRMSDLQVRRQTIDSVIDLAAARKNITSDARGKLESLQAQGWLPIDKRVAAVDSDFRSSEDLAQLNAQQLALTKQISALGAAFAQADHAADDLRHLYGGGELRAPIDGIVGPRLTEKGAVLGAGQPLMDIYGNDRFVLAYVPTGGLFRVLPGDRVRVSTGLLTFGGTIVRVEPIAVALPREFQRSFTPVDRRQLIRVEFAPGQEPPLLFSKVTLTGAEFVPAWLRAIIPSFL
jgi:multidrug resistance efflux pump